MTTGAKRNDGRTYYDNTQQGGTSWDGYDERRVWNGGDDRANHAAWNSYDSSYYRHVRARAYFHYYVPNVVDVWKVGNIWSLKSIPSPPNISDSDLISKVGSELRGHDFNALVAMGEGKETLALLLDALTRIKKSLLALRAGNMPLALGALLPSGKTPPKRSFPAYRVRPSLHQSWLELQYGWKPLLSDVYEAYKSFFDRSNIPRVQYARASQKTSADPVNDGAVGYTEFLNTRSRTVVVKLTEKHTVWQDYGLNDPLSLAWELLPFSFVADWFIPIGNYLEARSFVNGSVGEIAFIDKTSVRYKVDTAAFARVSPYYTGGGDVYFVSRSYARSPFTSLSTYNLPLPGFKPLVKAASIGHCLNALALVRGLTAK